jgi:hypothetical protein
LPCHAPVETRVALAFSHIRQPAQAEGGSRPNLTPF